MLGTTHDAGDQTSADSSRLAFADCAYLHSAFGPGCPYCEKAAPAGSGDAAGNSIHERPDHDRDLGAVA